MLDAVGRGVLDVGPRGRVADVGVEERGKKADVADVGMGVWSGGG